MPAEQEQINYNWYTVMDSWKKREFILLICLFFCGCATNKALYNWGDYETSIHDRMVENNDIDAYKNLQETIIESEQQGRRPPPGLYADYGFMLYKRGDKNKAVLYFEKEKKSYPEANQLMTKLIDKVREKSKPSPDQKTAPTTTQ